MPRHHLFLFAAFVAGIPLLPANPFEWTGAGGTNWSNGVNWTPGPPVGGTDTLIVFNSDTQLATILDLPGGIVLNSLTFGPTSGVRSINGSQPLIFAGVNPTITMANTVGTGSTVIGVPVQLQSTLLINGGLSFDRQLVFNTAAAISGTGGITLQGGLFATNSASSTFTGPVVVQGGLFGTNTAAGFGAASSVTVEAGGSVQLFGANANFTVNRPLVLAGAGAALQGSYSLAASGAGTKTWSGAITLADDTRITAFNGATLSLAGPIALQGNTLTAAGGGNANDRVFISGVISGEGDLIAASSAAGLGVVLGGTAANTFTGNVRVTAGRLGISQDNRLGPDSNVLTLDGGTLSAFSTVNFATIVVPATRTIVIGPAGGTFEGQRSTASTLSIQTVLSGENPITVRDSVTFGAANTFTGPLTVAPGGSLTTTSAAGLGDPASVLRLAGTNENNATGSTLVLGSSFTVPASKQIQITQDIGTILTQFQGTLAASVSGPGRLRLFTSGAGATLTAAGQSTHTGGTTLDGDGTILTASVTSLAPAGSAIEHASGRLRALGDLHFTSDYGFSVGFSSSGPRIDTNGFTVRIDSAVANISTFGTGRLFKEGAGRLLLNGANTYNGVTEVLGGTLGGQGSVAGNVIVRSGATLAPGSATEFGLFEIGGTLTFLDGSFAVKLGGTERGVSYDSLAVASGVSAAGNTLGISLVNGFENSISSTDTFVIMTYSQFVSGSFLNIIGGRIETSDGFGSFAVTIGAGGMVLTDYIGVIPEPATAAALLGLLALAWVVWRRRHMARAQ